MKNNCISVRKIVARGAVCVCVCDVLLVLFSWVVSSAFPDSSVRSLLGSEGLRWLFGSLSSNLCNTMLVWLLYIGVAYGILDRCGMAEALRQLRRGGTLAFRQRLALALTTGEMLAVALVMVLLTCIPHAILLSVSGDLFPSSFSRSLVPVSCLTLVLAGTTYGVVTGSIRSADEWFSAMSHGLKRMSTMLIAYVFCIQFAYMIYFVFFM